MAHAARPSTALRHTLARLALRCAVALHAGLLLVGAAAVHAAPPPSGAQISNRAEATYVPAGQVLPETLHSNTVTVHVQAVEALALSADTSVNRPAGAPLALPHVLANTGNIASSYRFELQNLAGDGYDLAALRLVRDLNANGVADPGEPDLPTAGAAPALTLGAGGSASLLLLGRVPLGAGAGGAVQALVRLSASTTGAPALTASVTDTVRTGRLAAVVLDKRADQAGNVLPGTTVNYLLVATNIGDAPAVPTALAGPAATPILIDGIPARVLLLRDPVPAGTVLVPGSLATSLPGAQRLFRLSGDAPFSYRTNGDDIAAVEVAVGTRTFALAPGVTASMGFAVQVRDGAAGTPIVNQGETWFDDGTDVAGSPSNTVTLQVPMQRIGLAKRASPALYEHDAAGGRLLGTARVRLSFVVENFGGEVARQVQVRDLLAGTQRFGTYTASAAPGPGQYTVLAGSARAVSLKNGAQLAPNPTYTGDADHADLIAPGATLPAFGAAELSVELRVNASGRDGVVLNTAEATATLGEPARASLRDDSVDGSVADANGDGDPGNDASPTPVRLSLPSIAVDKAASAWRRLEGSARRYEIDYAITVTNSGKTTASHVQVADNLNCTFLSDVAPSPVRRWELVGAPRFGNATLTRNPAYTGRAACPRPPARGGDPYAALSRDSAVLLTDGARHLEPGRSEVIRYTVRIELDPLARAGDRVFDNIAVASVLDRQDAATAGVVVAAAAVAEVVPIDPSGVVYQAGSRAPVEGAVVTLARHSCLAGGSGPITEAQLLPTPVGPYRLNADGSVSQTTDAQGRYAFYLRSPPVSEPCEYRLGVTPPDGSSLQFPSQQLPPDGAVAPGGPVQAQPGPPTGAQPTTHYLRFELGPGRPDVWNNHIPLDAFTRTDGLLAQKTANRTTVETGQTVDYTVRVRNVAGVTLRGLRISDRLPPGFRFIAGSARLDGRPSTDPAGAPGALLEFDWPAFALDSGREAVLVYRVQAGVGALPGIAVNRAQARAGSAVSNEAAFSLRVEGGVFAQDAYLVGKVYLDCNRDGVQGHEEIGIPGVRLLLEDGTGVVTDVEGKYSLYGLRAITHVLKLDTPTLPARARLGLLDSRQAGRADSRFVDLKKGELHKADFAVDNCELTEVVDEVKARRKALAQRPDAEGEAVSRARLEAQAVPEPNLAEVRRRAAAGEVGPAGPKPVGGAAVARSAVFDALRAPVAAGAAAAPFDRPPRATLPRVELEALLDAADATAGFVDLRDRDTLPIAQADIRVKGRLGSTLRLSVNGRVESEQRVGKRVRIASRELEAWEYIGVQLRAGENALLLEEVDAFGNVRGQRALTLIAPGRIGRIELELPASAAADPGTPVRVRVRLTDDRGVPVSARTPLTLEVERGRWETADLNPTEPGTQVFIEGGTAEFALIPPNEPQDALVRASSGLLTREQRIAWLPELRPLVGAGVLEGVIDLRRRAVVPVGSGSMDAFEQTLRHLSREGAGASGRVAFYFKGTVRGQYLLTAAFDSDKDTRERLFRDIQPDKFYPIYGDSAARIFDAQSSQRLFVRVDRERSYLLYGDFTTASADGSSAVDPRRLSQTNRSATGVKLHHESGAVSATAFASRDRLLQKVIELPADGTSGPYLLPGAGAWRENSERIEVLVRDRRQPARVLQTTPLQRFVDYVIDPLGRRVLFAAPVASLDPDLNPRHIRISLEVDSGGPAFWMGGADVQVKLDDGLQLGASVVRDNNPADATTLAGATAVLRPAIDPKSLLVAEVARSASALAGSGRAGRVEWTREGEDLTVRAQLSATGAHFVNPASGLGPGRTEAGVNATLRLQAERSLRVEALYSKDTVAQSAREGVVVSVGQRLGDAVQAELGVRTSRDTAALPPGTGTGTGVGAAVAANDLLTTRGRLAWRAPGADSAQVYLEAEQDLRASGKRMLAIGGDRQLGEQTRLYGRYELISSLGSPFALNPTQQNNVAVIGIDSAYLADGRVFNEFRLRDSLNGREGQVASGVRKSWVVTPGLRLAGGFERTAAFGGVSGNRSTALTGAAEYTGDDRYRLYGGLEARLADAGDAYLNTLGLAYKISKDWSLLARSTVSTQDNSSDRMRTLLARQQLGVAWRQVDIDRWNALARYEHALKDIDGGAAAEREQAHVVSAHLNLQPGRGLILAGRYAVKVGRHAQGGVASDFRAQLLHGRVTWDLSRRWDTSVQAALHRGQQGVARHALGVETGFRLDDNLWLSVGYNRTGLRDELLGGNDVLDRGPYLRVRYKFDERLFK